MARARLHVICGNCGCNDNFVLKIVRDAVELFDGTFEDEAYLSCKNCATLHALSDNSKKEKK